MRLRLVPFVLAVLIAAPPYAPAPAAQAPPGAARATARASLGALDVIALEICYTTILARYYKPVDPGDLLRGARRGITAYLTSRGIANVSFSAAPARIDRYGAESAIDRDVALAVARYGTRVRTADLVSKTIAGELDALQDPYSVLFPPAGFKKFVGFLDGKPQAGIGAELDVDPRTHAVRVVEIFLDSPAEGSGLRVGDTITSIDGSPPPATTPDAVARALRGAPGTSVRIGFTHDGVPQEPLTIVRRIFAPPDVTTRILTDGIAYIRIRSFGAHAPQELDVSLRRLRVVKPRAYILDLRANGGGYRDAAVSIGGRFVHGTIVTTQERTGKPVVFAAKSGVVPLGLPLAVLVDGDTASAAEIVAGAIQDEKTGTLVGTRTFGKGLVQETFALPDGGAIKLTTARYLTPAGRDIDKVGITPDVIVAQPPDAHPGETGRDAQLDRAFALLKASLPPAPSSSPGTQL